MSYLVQSDRHNLWLAHSMNDLVDYRPDPNKFNNAEDYRPNVAYIRWTMRQMPYRVSNPKIDTYVRTRNNKLKEITEYVLNEARSLYRNMNYYDYMYDYGYRRNAGRIRRNLLYGRVALINRSGINADFDEDAVKPFRRYRRFCQFCHQYH